MIENFGDIPFFKSAVPASTIAAMTAAIIEIRSALSAIRDTPVGVNVLRNDACAALSIAVATGAKFIRVNVLTSARVTDQGVIEGASADLARLKRMINANDIKVLADIDVKHSAPLAPRPVEEEVADNRRTRRRGRPHRLRHRHRQTDRPRMAKKVRAAAPGTPIYVGSRRPPSRPSAPSSTTSTASSSAPHFKHNGKVAEPVDPERVRAFVKKVKG
jgi:membrane complex biogenesis BtpA family protein